MDKKEIYKMHADFCKFMGNSNRIEIIFLLAEQEMCVEELASEMEINIPNLSQHLAVMRSKSVVKNRRDGTKIFYSLSNPKIYDACLMMRDIMIEQCRNKADYLNQNIIGENNEI
ncbi:MAG TPA: transcriptional regulator [Spirochaetia bacterium]|nr:transcriptional regulator [Spirochaetia bacterium]